MLIELIKLLIYSVLIVIISKKFLVNILRKLAKTLQLTSKITGDISGYATSMPELLTIGVASFNGLVRTSIINVISSNIINLLQYLFSIYLNNNQKTLKNKAIMVNLILVILTIIIPIILLKLKIKLSIVVVPFFIILYLFFQFLNKNVHKLYLQKQDKILKEKFEKESRWEKRNKSKIILYSFYLITTGVLLFFISNELGEVLENLCYKFNISQLILGLLLGMITSIPELITFVEAQKHYKGNKKEELLGVIEATNNLFTSNILNLFIIQSVGIVIYTVFVYKW